MVTVGVEKEWLGGRESLALAGLLKQPLQTGSKHIMPCSGSLCRQAADLLLQAAVALLKAELSHVVGFQCLRRDAASSPTQESCSGCCGCSAGHLAQQPHPAHLVPRSAAKKSSMSVTSEYAEGLLLLQHVPCTVARAAAAWPWPTVHVWLAKSSGSMHNMQSRSASSTATQSFLWSATSGRCASSADAYHGCIGHDMPPASCNNAFRRECPPGRPALTC